MALRIDLDIEKYCPEVTEKSAKEFLVAAYYSKGKIPSKIACDLIGANRRDFADILEKHGFSVFTSIDKDDLDSNF